MIWNDLKNDKYAQIKSFHYDYQLQVYMYNFMYVDPETMAEEEYFPSTKTFVTNYKNMSTTGPVPKHWIVCSYLRSEYDELDLNFYETYMKI